MPSTYAPYPVIDNPNRQWPSKQLTRAPQWCSVDLRDGNQALPKPMGVEAKLKFFKVLCDIGFKEIEIGFPSASDTEFEFARRLIEEGHVPPGVRLQVLTQAREKLINRTFEALKGAEAITLHMYNSTSPAHRESTFGGASKAKILNMAVEGTHMVKALTPALEAGGTDVQFEYSPESFSQTEVDFAFEVCQAVHQTWQPTSEKPMVFNLPATVEVTTPNVYADQIEVMCGAFTGAGMRESSIVSVHTHNDRGTCTAATELALLAGADRVEGTLFGNGERTGNLDLVQVALNMMQNGIDTGLNFENLPAIRAAYQEATRMEVPPRHPYAGDLVFTAFSGSHQDAIKKGLELIDSKNTQPNTQLNTQTQPGVATPWDVPYLHINPSDIGRGYEPLVRFNSQSGKGGAAHILKAQFGLDMPKAMQPAFGAAASAVADAQQAELGAEDIHALFEEMYLTQPSAHMQLTQANATEDAAGQVSVNATAHINGKAITLNGSGNGPINALINGIYKLDEMDDAACNTGFHVSDFHSHAIGEGSEAEAATYVEITDDQTGETFWGCGIHTSTQQSNFAAALSAINNRHAQQQSMRMKGGAVTQPSTEIILE